MKIKFTFLTILCVLFMHNSQAQVQNALWCDGMNDYVDVPAGSALIAGSNQISLTCLVYPLNPFTAYPDFDGFAGIRNDLDADFYLLQVGSNHLEARFTNSSGTIYTMNYMGFQLNTWQHYAFTYDGSMLRLFRDGAAVDSLAATGTITNPNVNFLAGNVRYTGADFYLLGKIDEVSLWNISLTESDVHCIYKSAVDSLASGLQLYYTCNQGIPAGNNISQTVLHDAANHIDGNLMGFALTGTSSNYVDGISNYTVISDSICNGDQYVFGPQTLTTAGVYYHNLQTFDGCDSTIELTLAVISPDTAVTLIAGTLASLQSGGTYQWVDCNNGFTPVSGAVNSSFTPSVNGSYAVIVTAGGCTDTSGCYAVTGTGISETGTDDLNIYPVVSGKALTVSSSQMLRNVLLSVTDMNGRRLYAEQFPVFEKVELDLSAFQAGVYFVTASSDQGHVIRRFIVK